MSADQAQLNLWEVANFAHLIPLLTQLLKNVYATKVIQGAAFNAEDQTQTPFSD